MNRPTKKIELPISGMTAIIYDYYLRGDRKEIEQIMLNSAEFKLDQKTGKSEYMGLTGNYKTEMEDKAVLLAVKELNDGDKTIKPTVKVLDQLPAEDFDMLRDALPDSRSKKK
ncbi:MAG: hypothetical protein U9O78_02060 [Patescibacteria group bacterium]|nr:hypothetical protein [Patescibacteria group bacterium]